MQCLRRAAPRKPRGAGRRILRPIHRRRLRPGGIDAAKSPEHCYYLDAERPNGDVVGSGSCGQPEGHEVSVDRVDGLSAGAVGSWEAAAIRITMAADRVTVPVVGGFFLVPARFSDERLNAPVTLTLLGAEGTALATVRDLTLPGSAVPTTV
jgi:hypothetical protein